MISPNQVRNTLRHAMLENLGLKILALFIAFFLWFLVSSQQSMEKYIDAPVEVMNKPSTLEIANDYLKTVTVQLVAPQIQRDTFLKSVVATVDLSGAHPGENVVMLTEKNFRLPYGVRIQSIRPATLTFVLEPSQSKFVPVKVRFVGHPAQDHAVTEVMSAPDHVLVSGALSHVAEVVEVPTQTVDLAGRMEPFATSVPLQMENPFVSLGYTQKVRVQVNIQERSTLKVFADLPVNLHGLPAPGRVVPAAVTAYVRLPLSLRDRIQTEDFELYVDGSQLPDGALQGMVPVQGRVANPAYRESVRIEKIVPDSVRVMLKGR